MPISSLCTTWTTFAAISTLATLATFALLATLTTFAKFDCYLLPALATLVTFYAFFDCYTYSLSTSDSWELLHRILHHTYTTTTTTAQGNVSKLAKENDSDSIWRGITPWQLTFKSVLDWSYPGIRIRESFETNLFYTVMFEPS